MGVKPGYGPVIKVMRDAADHPWTTPNTDWDKFIVNSEVQEIAYGHVGISHTFVPADYSFPTGAFPDVRYWPNEANWIWRSDARTSGGSAYLFFHFNLENIPDTILNAFHFLIRDASDWVSLWTRRTYRYNANDWYHQFSRKYWFTPRQQDVDYGLGILYDSDTGTWSQWEFLVSLWPTGVVGNDNSETSGPNSQSYYTTREFKFSYYRLDLPMDGSAYPAVVGTPSPGKKILRCSPSGFRMAKPGFDLDSATTEQLLFSDENVPLKIIRTGTVTLAPLATAQVDLGAVYPSSILVDFQVNAQGEALFLPPMRVSEDDSLDVEYRINGQYLEFRSASSFTVEVRFFVMSADDLEPSVGTAKVLEAVDGGFVLRRPNTAGSRLADVILDTRFPTMPIIAQGWVPFSAMVATDTLRYGTHRAIVSYDAKGYKPYILARLVRRHKTNTNQHIFRDFSAKKPNRYGFLAASSFCALIKSDEVWFYCSDGTRAEDVYYEGSNPFPTHFTTTYEPVGIRYYIFAVPPSV